MRNLFNLFKQVKGAPEYKELTDFLANNETFKDMALKAHNMKLKGIQSIDKAAFPEEHANKKYITNGKENIKNGAILLNVNEKQNAKLLQLFGTDEFQEYYLDQKAVILNFHSKNKASNELGAALHNAIFYSNGWSILKIDIEDPENYELKHEFNVETTPQTHLVVDGKDVEIMYGYIPTQMNNMFAKACSYY
ncbi:Thioredoxin-like fold [Pseudocohnilembus persalinus]|uniref:Thioredoxin-like fold n=1 Tax=Pseudocohnilembus persalinus TaxID=266149 RepID=A0A0V0R2W5_PSEPJ|nr:Thioredoxin-like fold [Pseudocohnilembus persalinus]|eukprot:KRX08850.1 Thioredoxin-like fold [Pseudocohnilembus persalinus]